VVPFPYFANLRWRDFLNFLFFFLINIKSYLVISLDLVLKRLKRGAWLPYYLNDNSLPQQALPYLE
ncbi:MAG: hypothetical protein WBJ87_08335, partial [Candidatus Hydrothermia bacterium]